MAWSGSESRASAWSLSIFMWDLIKAKKSTKQSSVPSVSAGKFRKIHPIVQVSPPVPLTCTVMELPELTTSRQRRLLTVPLQLAVKSVVPLLLQLSGRPSPPAATAVAHSFAKPMVSPILAPASAAARAWRYCGSATADRRLMTATTIISSTKVKA